MKPNVKPQWLVKPKYTFEDLLDQPCKMHSSPGKPAAHTTRQCDFVKRTGAVGGTAEEVGVVGDPVVAIGVVGCTVVAIGVVGCMVVAIGAAGGSVEEVGAVNDACVETKAACSGAVGAACVVAMFDPSM